jgi:hypothetical protein
LGVSISLLFVRGRAIDEILGDLDLAMTDEHREAPLVLRGAFVTTRLPSGFHMIWSNTCDERRFSKPVLTKMSDGGEAVVQRVEEHVMFSQAEFWRDGRQMWSLQHAGDIDATNLQLEGTLPILFDTFRQEEEARAADEQDFFDIPIRMTDHVTGYRYDRVHDWEKGMPYTALVSTTPVNRPFWKFW